MSPCRHPGHCLIPPVVLQRIAEHGDDHQRAWALRALDTSSSIRFARAQNAMVRGMGPREGADALAVRPVPTPNRQISDAQGEEDVVGPLVRAEGDEPTFDEAVDEAYDGFGDTFAYFLEVHQRNSIDDAGMPLRGVVHFGRDFANAFWDGRRMVFGDGDGEILGRMTQSLDVIGHELGHGVVEDEAGLVYEGQSGALNEHMADVFGSLVKQHKLHQRADQANWLIGEDVWTPTIAGDALRSMKAPGMAYDDPLVGKDPQPAHMDDFVVTLEDNGGVHINSGIPNKAFYLVATALGGFAWERAGIIWYESLRDPACTTETTFAQFAAISVRVAGRLYGGTSSETTAVRDAWEGVGLGVGMGVAAA